jgi:hypothetical protein
MWQAMIAPVLGTLDNILDKFVVDADLKTKLKHEASLALITTQNKELENAVQIILAEANGESWLQRNWRPMLMLWFAGLVGAHWLGFTPENLSESTVLALLDIVQVGIGGYVLGRSGEKMIREWKK